jgi:UDP-N-acetyl-D-mannosaminuronic acid transferase (WecB/TagA/CpsF family)
LGIDFYTGDIAGLMARTLEGGLIVVPSAPVLVNLTADPAHREALEQSDLAITDSGYLVLLWRLLTGEKLIRISGLRYLRHLLTLPEFREPGATFWVMPTAHDATANIAWLQAEGIPVAENATYLAPHYARQGPLADPALLAAIQAQRPRFVMLNLGGNVQERLGHYLRNELARIAQVSDSSLSAFPPSPISDLRPSISDLRSPIYENLPAIICTGAAIAFLSGRQANIPPWADRLYLGWLLRSLSEPAKFLPRYWQALRLFPLLWKHRDRSVAPPE